MPMPKISFARSASLGVYFRFPLHLQALAQTYVDLERSEDTRSESGEICGILSGSQMRCGLEAWGRVLPVNTLTEWGWVLTRTRLV
jgi:hypothetical protein